MMPPTPFASVDDFRDAFSAGLSRLLEAPELGTYILALANASFDHDLYQSLCPSLLTGYGKLAAYCQERLRLQQEIEGDADDVSVFLKLMAVGIEGLQLSRFRTVGEWELQFNQLRAFRPARLTAERVIGSHRPFDPSGFHFNKPFLRREAIWSGQLLGEPVELLFNKYPFVSMHGLLVPDRQAEYPQHLTRRHHDYAWRLCESLGARLPGWGLGYNSYGAYASVNHLHFQTFVRERPLPISRSHWRHHGGDKAYPLACEVYDEAEAAWRRIDSLHGAACSYNLIYEPGRLFCQPRRTQGTYENAGWSGGFAWYEVAGGFATASLEAFEALDAATIDEALARIALSD